MGAAVAAVLDFGAFPGASDASVTVTGLTGIATSSRVEAYIEPAASADHTSDEHMVETIKVFADKSSIVADTSCVVKGFNTSQLNEPLEAVHPAPFWPTAGTARGDPRNYKGGNGTRIYGKFNVVLVWS